MASFNKRLRSSGPAEYGLLDPSDLPKTATPSKPAGSTVNMITRSKKQKIAEEKFLCFACDKERVARQFPDNNPSTGCTHYINTCTTCLKKWISAQIDSGALVRRIDRPASAGGDGEGNSKANLQDANSNLVFGIHCPHPDCKSVMINADMKDAATKKAYKRFDELERRFIGDSTPNWRWCLSLSCRAGQVHISSTVPAVPEKSRPKKSKKDGLLSIFGGGGQPAIDDKTDVCTCTTCGTQACVDCDRLWHKGETCSQFRARTKDRVDEEDKSLRAIDKGTKACPGCKKRIQKNGRRTLDPSELEPAHANSNISVA